MTKSTLVLIKSQLETSFIKHFKSFTFEIVIINFDVWKREIGPKLL